MIRRSFALLGLLSAATLAAAPRQELSLNGGWDCSVGPGKASKVAIPGYLSGVDDQVAMLSREFVVPEAMKGQRLKLRFGGVKYSSTILVNGKQVGAHFGGYEPFEADVTDAIRFGAPNQLVVRCQTWAGVMTDGPKQFSKAGGWDQVRNAPRDRVLAPVGGLYGLYGIWDDVTLVSHPAVYIQALFIKPSVRRGELVVDYVLANESAADAEVELSAAVEGAIVLPKATVKIPAGTTATVTLKSPWPKPHLWSHADPYLYVLNSALRTPPPALGDALASRFGFREFWCQGPDFYLNGSKIHLLASSGWPPHGPKTREEIAAFWRGLKGCGCVAFRTHTQPWPAAYYDVADEVGILVVGEAAVWNDDDIYRVNDPAFWDNYAAHLAAMVARDKNHPSVVMWSLENEMTGGRVNDNTPFPKEQLIRLGKLVKQLDPTRPIMYESDGDPGGVADVIGIHYPHEYPDYTCWPNEGYWLDKPWRGHGGGGFFFNGEKEFLWKRDKPLYIGEFLWIPSRGPSWHTVFFGDDAYLDYRRYRNLAKAESWKMQILAYRVQGVSGICPWTVTEGGPLDDTNPLWRAHKWAYQPIAAYCLDYDTRFYAGDKVTRRVEVFNDTLGPATLVLNWVVRDAATSARENETRQELTLGPAEHRELPITLAMPGNVDRPMSLEWILDVVHGGKIVQHQALYYLISPRPRLPELSVRVGLLDPLGETRKLFDAYGLRTEPVASLAKPPAGITVLVIGAGALGAGKKGLLAIGQVAPEREALASFLARGGRVLVLEQDAYPEGLFDLGITRQRSTMAYPLRPNHPALRGLVPQDLTFWRGDHFVTQGEPSRPAKGGAIPIVVSGSAAGLDHAPLLEVPVARGCLILSQLLLVRKFASEPAAAQILGNLLRYLADYRPREGKTAVIGGSAEYHAHLRSLGLRFDALKVPPREPSTYSLLICRGGTTDAVPPREFVEQGGNVLLHRLSAEALDSVRQRLGIGLMLQPYSGHIARREPVPPWFGELPLPEDMPKPDDPLLGSLAREDLYWLGAHKGIAWAQTQRATGMADGVFTKSLDGLKPVTHEVENWALEGGIVERRDGKVIFATVGSASAEIDFPKTGSYVFGLLASGSPCQGVFPIATVAVGDNPLGSASVDSRQPRLCTVFGEVQKGRHKVTVAFINDASDPAKGEDTNLIVDKLLVALDERDRDVSFLTGPPAVAVIRRGKGVVVLDQVRWDTEEPNARKAARYACSLLTALGGDFESRPSWAIEAETMTPQPTMPHFGVHGSYVTMACSGWIKTPIEVAVAGRYTMEVVAGGSAAQGVYPHIEISVDGTKAGEVQLTSGGLRPYLVAIELPEGKHELSLRFTNDLNVGGEDRNLTLDKVVFYRE
ncbi:MAG TPA: carbohydrate-binding domain-containing protein [Planctomycetota bacterium]|nr:carbohydrate-binding domain-containing protein [Planctomycetota bacterium]